MSVSELIAQLQQLPQDAEVWVSVGGEYVSDLSGEFEVEDGRVIFSD